MDGKIGRDRSDFEAGGPSRFPAVRIYAFAFIRFHGFTVLRGKAFPLVGTSLGERLPAPVAENRDVQT